jgi:23S rRNA pseudouridine1911/1915/1917 synthase
VHLKFLGNPVAGDPVYGKRGSWERHLLHAWKLSFDHPVTGERLSFEAPPPPEFRFA